MSRNRPKNRANKKPIATYDSIGLARKAVHTMNMHLTTCKVAAKRNPETGKYEIHRK